MSLVFVGLILVTLFGINHADMLTGDEIRTLEDGKIYFVHPDFGDDDISVGEDHEFYEHELGSISYVLNHAKPYYQFRESIFDAGVYTFAQDIEHAQVRALSAGVEINHKITVEYRCDHEDERGEDALIAFHNHMQPTAHHSGDTIFQFTGCRMLIKWRKFTTDTARTPGVELPGGSTKLINSDRLRGLYVRAGDFKKRILYLTNREHELQGYDFWKARSYMFHDSDIINKFDHSFVFNPVMISYQSDVADVADLCNEDKLADITRSGYEGIILVDHSLRAAGYLADECLENIHLKNIGKQWREIWRYLKPLELPLRGGLIGNRLSNHDKPDGTPSPPTIIESSVEVMHRAHTAPLITWNACELTGHFLTRKCTIKSVGDDCQCASSPTAGTPCAHHCSKTLYIMPSFHNDEFRSSELRTLVMETPNIHYIAAELDSFRFKRNWESLYQYSGDYAEFLPETWNACRLATDPRNINIKKLVLADLEAHYMYSRDVDGGFHLLRPKDNKIYPIWMRYYRKFFTPIRNHALVPTVNGIVYSEMQESEAIVLPMGMKHYNPLYPPLIDMIMSNYAPAERDEARKNYMLINTVFSNYWGHGVNDLLNHPEKLKKMYQFRTTPVRDARRAADIHEWTPNHKNHWNRE